MAEIPGINGKFNIKHMPEIIKIAAIRNITRYRFENNLWPLGTFIEHSHNHDHNESLSNNHKPLYIGEDYDSSSPVRTSAFSSKST